MTVTNPAIWKRLAAVNPLYEQEQAERTAVFNKIAPVDNWKNPICATIEAADFDDCNEAAIWFTGKPLTQAQILPDGKLVVVAPGYYVAIGS